MVPWFRKSALLLLQRAQVWFLAPTQVPTTICNASSGGSNTFLWPLWTLGIHVMHIHIGKQTHT